MRLGVAAGKLEPAAAVQSFVLAAVPAAAAVEPGFAAAATRVEIDLDIRQTATDIDLKSPELADIHQNSVLDLDLC